MTSQNVVNNEIPQIVATPCDSHGRAMVMAMTGASKFTASFYDYNYTSQWRTDQSVQFNNQNGGSTSGSPDTNLTSIAMDQNGSLYGISSDGKTVIAYSWSSNTAVRYYLSWKENIVIE